MDVCEFLRNNLTNLTATLSFLSPGNLTSRLCMVAVFYVLETCKKFYKTGPGEMQILELAFPPFCKNDF
jgi:hypothetical protein